MKGVDLFDVFEKGGEKSLALRIQIGSDTKTLTSEEIDAVMNIGAFLSGMYDAVQEEFDLIVLSVGIRPGTSVAELGERGVARQVHDHTELVARRLGPGWLSSG